MNLKFLNNFSLIIVLSILISKTNLDVPVYIQGYISLGYDSNPLRLSYDEIQYSEHSDLLLNDADGISSNTTSIYGKISYNPKLINNRKTRLSLSFKRNIFFQHENKNNKSINFNINQSIGGYKKIYFNYYLMPDFYLREYRDIDEIINNDFTYTDIYDSLQSAYFSIEKIKLGYEFPVDMLLSKIKLEINQEKQYYDPIFTEFDLDIVGASFSYSNSNFSMFFNYSVADNSTYLDGLFSTNYMDRSYEQYQYKLTYDKQLENNISFGIIANIYNRLYSSNIYNDALHRTRTHIDSNVSLWYKFFISELKNKIQFTYRMRSTDSIFDWVEDLKSFKRYYLTYTVYLDKIEL